MLFGYASAHHALAAETKAALRAAEPGDMGETAAEVASSYRAELEELTFNSKPIINSLTMIAEELLPHAGVIVEVVDSKIRSAPADQKLPVIYLMDSIVKNIGGAYKEQFARHVPELIGLTYAVATPKVMTSLKNLAKTWDGVFPADVVKRVTAGLSGGGAAPSAPPPSQPTGADTRKRPRGEAAPRPRSDAARSDLAAVVQRVHAHVGAGLAADGQLMDLIARSIDMYRQLLQASPRPRPGRPQGPAPLPPSTPTAATIRCSHRRRTESS